ncbi:NUMOD4 motif-containing protein [Nocardiopsis flavescens]|uniref:NUMOD4 motif-containing protein n=1 Tax=Nocardiopsis flavescens TaxID=758803 RepID=A0A1M6KHP5_9ACTN|nr:NUMOD4 motif-containing protein [Nocardiopsis flavescens]
MTGDEREQWRAVVGFPGYEVSSLGNVRSWSRYKRGELLKLRPGTTGYPHVTLWRDGRCHRPKVHRLVALAFIGPRPDGQQVRHLDGDRLNNAADNLAYGTPSQNVRDSVRHGTHPEVRKTSCRRGHPFDTANTYVDPSGRRVCRACKLQRQRRRRARLASA